MKEDLFANSSSHESKCKGIYFRYSKSEYWSTHLSIEKRESYRILKRISCKGECSKKCMRDFF